MENGFYFANKVYSGNFAFEQYWGSRSYRFWLLKKEHYTKKLRESMQNNRNVVTQKAGCDFLTDTVDLFMKGLNNNTQFNLQEKEEMLDFLFLEKCDSLNPFKVEYNKYVKEKIENLDNQILLAKNKYILLKKMRKFDRDLTRESELIKRCSIKTSLKERLAQELNKIKEDFKEKNNLVKKFREEKRFWRERKKQLVVNGKKYKTFKEFCDHKAMVTKNGRKPALDRVKNKESFVTERLLFLLKNPEYRDRLLPEKNPLIQLGQPIKLKTNEGKAYKMRTLGREDVVNALAYGVTTPCCLGMMTSGVQFSMAILFDPNVTLSVIEDENGHPLTTVVTSYDTKNKNIRLSHIDKSREAEITPKVTGLMHKMLAKKLCENAHIKGTQAKVVANLGEATLDNVVPGFENDEEAKKLNSKLEAHFSKKMNSCELAENINIERSDVNFPYLTFAYENYNELTPELKEDLKKFTTKKSGFEFYGSNESSNDDLFGIFNPEQKGHKLSSLAFGVITDYKSYKEISKEIEIYKKEPLKEMEEKINRTKCKNHVSQLNEMRYNMVNYGMVSA